MSFSSNSPWQVEQKKGLLIESCPLCLVYPSISIYIDLYPSIKNLYPCIFTHRYDILYIYPSISLVTVCWIPALSFRVFSAKAKSCGPTRTCHSHEHRQVPWLSRRVQRGKRRPGGTPIAGWFRMEHLIHWMKKNRVPLWLRKPPDVDDIYLDDIVNVT